MLSLHHWFVGWWVYLFLLIFLVLLIGFSLDVYIEWLGGVVSLWDQLLVVNNGIGLRSRFNLLLRVWNWLSSVWITGVFITIKSIIYTSRALTCSSLVLEVVSISTNHRFIIDSSTCSIVVASASVVWGVSLLVGGLALLLPYWGSLLSCWWLSCIWILSQWWRWLVCIRPKSVLSSWWRPLHASRSDCTTSCSAIGPYSIVIDSSTHSPV